MKPGIILNFPAGMAMDEKNKFIQSVNQKLDPIQQQVNSWNGFIDLKQVSADQYQAVPICDNDEIRQQMEELLSN